MRTDDASAQAHLRMMQDRASDAAKKGHLCPRLPLPWLHWQATVCQRENFFKWCNGTEQSVSISVSSPDLNSPFEVICDACGVGRGAVLVQGGRPIAFAFEGKRLSEAEQKYTTGEQELLAAVHTLTAW